MNGCQNRSSQRRQSLPGVGLPTAALVAAFLLTISASRVSAVTVRLAAGAPPQPGGWATLRITLSHRLIRQALRLTIRDARGGPATVCRVNDNRRHVLVPLAYVAPATLPMGRWPVILTEQTNGGRRRTWKIQVRIPASLGAPRVVVAIPPGTTGLLSKIAVLFKPARLAAMPITTAELRRSPPLDFSSCRAVLLNRRSAALLSRRRALQFIGVGTRLIYAGNQPPRWLPAGEWVTPPAAHRKLWESRAAASFPPVIVERLRRLGAPAPSAPKIWRIAALACGPIVLVAILLIRLATRRIRTGLFGLAVMAATISAGTIYLLDLHAGERAQRWSWRVLFHTGYVQTQCTLTALQTPRPATYAMRSNPGREELPISRSPIGWFSIRGKIFVHPQSCGFQVKLRPGRPTFFYQQRVWPLSLRLTGLPGAGLAMWGKQKGFKAAANAAIISRGRFFQLNNPEHAHGVESWLGRQPRSLRQAVRAWLALQFKAGHRYLVYSGTGPGSSVLHVVDFGRRPLSRR